MTEWHSDIVTKWPGDQVTEWPRNPVIEWPSDRVTEWPSDRVTGSFADYRPYRISICHNQKNRIYVDECFSCGTCRLWTVYQRRTTAPSCSRCPLTSSPAWWTRAAGGSPAAPSSWCVSCRYSTTHVMMYTVHRCSSLLQVKMWKWRMANESADNNT